MKGRIKSSKKRRACSFPSPKLQASDTGFPARRGNGLPFVFERLQKKTFPFRRTKIRDFPITNKRTANQKDWGEGKTLTPPGQDAPLTTGISAPPHYCSPRQFHPRASARPLRSIRLPTPFPPLRHAVSLPSKARCAPIGSPSERTRRKELKEKHDAKKRKVANKF